MSVAEKPITETPTRSPSAQLAWHSLLGGIFVLASLWLILVGLPLIWTDVLHLGASGQTPGLFNEFLSGALLLMVTGAAIVGLGYLGLQMEKGYYAKGLREGAFVGAFFLYFAARIALAAGRLLHRQELGMEIGLVVTVGLFLGLVFLLYKWFSLPGFAAWLGRLSDSGWFETNVFKGNQGVRIRRITVIALLILGFWGIITLINQRALGTERPNQPNEWHIDIPFSGTPDYPNTLPLMFKVHLVAPIVLGALLIWFAWRIVNLPSFSDFLIATEAEMNKVSWTTRKRLFQDTVVVLTTVIFMTVFLFVVDILWIKILSSDWIYVLQVDTREARQQLQEKAKW
jgi:preprotein translocase SecE subunit